MAQLNCQKMEVMKRFFIELIDDAYQVADSII